MKTTPESRYLEYDNAVKLIRSKRVSVPAKQPTSNNVTPLWLEALLCIVLFPVLVPIAAYASVKWIVRKVKGVQ